MRTPLRYLLGALALAACQAPTPPPAPALSTPPASRPWRPPPSAWTWRNPSPQGLTLRAVWGSGPGDLYVAGMRGALLHSTDGGASWTALPPPATNALYGLWGASPEEVYAVGAQGTLLASKDHGQTWDPRAAGTHADLLALWGDDAGRRYAAGTQGTLLRSTDHGQTWAPLSTGTTQTLTALWGDARGLYAAGTRGAFLWSQDYGETWSPLKLPEEAAAPPASGPLRPHEHEDKGPPSVLGLAGKTPGEIFLATSGGALRATRGPTGAHSLARLRASDPHAGYAAVSGGDDPWFLSVHEVARPDKRGALVTVGALPDGLQPLAAWRAKDASLALVVGINGALARSTDGGKTWSAPPQLTRDDWNDLTHTARALHGLTSEALFTSLDEGSSWTARPLPPAPSAELRAGLSLFSATSGALYVVGLRAALRTYDDGQTWEELRLPTPPESPTLRALTGDGHGLLLGLSGGTRDAHYLSRDDGHSWSAQPAPAGARYQGAWVSPSGTLFLVGGRRDTKQAGAIWSSRDHGKTWQERAARTTLHAIDGDSADIFAVGREGLILHSQDDGETWQEARGVTNDHLAGVHVCGEGRAVAVGLYPGAFYTGDGGLRWERLSGLPLRILRHAAGGCDALWLAGEAGTLLRAAPAADAATQPK